MALAWCSLVLSLLGAGAALVCPDGTACHDGSTCCEDVLGRYGCCPLPNSGRGSAVMCPDRHSECPDATTCCQLPDGSWGCCPLAKAVCCDDKRHCCPEGTACDLSRSICASAGRDWRGWRPLVEKLPAGPGLGAPATCPDETTCCQVSSGAYGCCPVPDATCCSDRLHCCPHGTVCNLAAGTCDEAAGERRDPETRDDPPLAEAVAVTTVNARDERTGRPPPQAVCCEDGSRRPPAGHTCLPRRSSRSRGRRVIPWLAKAPAATRPAAVADVKCDDKSSCAAGTTCCKLPTGEWGCCPLVKAVCCADREHCCPQGYSCNMETGTCEKKTHAASVAPEVGGVPCDAAATFTCARRETCCRTTVSQWACCPSPQAVCCADMKHCCPARFSCHPSGGCVRAAPGWDGHA
ncbi:granulin b isoform X2 [Phyllopteryx taeniolatus]|uniref:granulin b isoform X2 n=1 Tax=Phyllopteryx taeniolatus TaxID=161469 RepID=UPI002AD5A1A0|nr:granulin b isoform X2 [Phyllopteryx taeniolatus]